MRAQVDDILIEKLRALPPDQRADVEDFVDFLTGRARQRAALDLVRAIAPALEAAGVEPISMAKIDADVKAARTARRARAALSTPAPATRNKDAASR